MHRTSTVRTQSSKKYVSLLVMLRFDRRCVRDGQIGKLISIKGISITPNRIRSRVCNVGGKSNYSWIDLCSFNCLCIHYCTRVLLWSGKAIIALCDLFHSALAYCQPTIWRRYRGNVDSQRPVTVLKCRSGLVVQFEHANLIRTISAVNDAGKR